MPIFEFHCKACKCDFEVFVWSSDDEKDIACPKCKAHDTKKLLSACSARTTSGFASLGGGCGPSSGSGFS